MPIRTRVQRLWRLVVDWWRASPDTRSPSPTVPAGPERSEGPATVPPRMRRPRAPADRARSREGEPLIAGVVTVRMWIVGGRLVLASSQADAERALVALLPELDAEGQGAVRTLLDTLRGGHAAAA